MQFSVLYTKTSEKIMFVDRKKRRIFGNFNIRLSIEGAAFVKEQMLAMISTIELHIYKL